MSGVRNYVLSTVTVAAATFDLTSLLNVKTDLSITDDDAAVDIYLKRVIRQVSAAIAQECNRTFALQTYQDVFRPQQDSWPVTLPNSVSPIMLENVPVVSIASITLQDGTVLVANTDYEANLDTGELWRLDSNGNPRGWTAVKTTVVYQAGWTLPGQAGPNQLLDTASDLEDVTIRLIKARWIARDRDPFLKSDEVTGVGRMEFWIPNSDNGNFPPDIQDILDNYRRLVVG